MLRDERLQLADERAVPAEREIGVDPVLERGEPELLEPVRLRPRERLVREVGERRAAPERERLAAAAPTRSRRLRPRAAAGPRRTAGRTGRRRTARARSAACSRAGATPAARASRAPARLERLAQMRDVPLDDVGGRVGRRPAPELVDQAVERHHLVRVQQEQREDCPLLRSPERQGRPVRGDLERAQDAEVERVRTATVPGGAARKAAGTGPGREVPATAR